MSLCVIFERLGPYHAARLESAARLLPACVIEVYGMDHTYAWDRIKDINCFQRITLFDQYESQTSSLVIKRIQEALRRIQPSVVAIPGWEGAANLGALEWCLNNKARAVLMCESQMIDSPRFLIKEHIKSQIVRCFSSALVGGISHASYVAQLGMPIQRIFLGYDAVDNDFFSAKAGDCEKSISKYRDQYGLPEKYFLASSRFVEKKNLPRLIEAYAKYRALCDKQKVNGKPQQPWNLILLGDGPLRSTVLSIMSAFKLNDYVQLPGFKQYPDLPVYYGGACAFILPSTTEQWGLVVNEAMASGLPVLVSDRCGCARELVKNDVNGFVFDPYNSEDLAGLMLKISDPDFPLAAFGLESQRIIAQWGPDRFGAELKSAIDCALRTETHASLLQRAILKFASRC